MKKFRNQNEMIKNETNMETAIVLWDITDRMMTFEEEEKQRHVLPELW